MTTSSGLEDVKEVRAGAHRISYRVVGDGDPILMLAGALHGGDSWIELGYTELLTDRYRLLLIDPLGFGRSDRPHDARAYSFDRRVEHCDAVLDAEGIETAHVWGYSFGAMVAEAYGQARPDRVRSLVLGGTLPGLDAGTRRAIYSRHVDLYGAGDWSTIFDTLFPGMPEPMRSHLAADNDALAVAAHWEGSFEPFDPEGVIPSCPMLCYVGTGEWFWEAARDATEARGGVFAPIPETDHFGTVRACGPVVEVVDAHLSAM